MPSRKSVLELVGRYCRTNDVFISIRSLLEEIDDWEIIKNVISRMENSGNMIPGCLDFVNKNVRDKRKKSQIDRLQRSSSGYEIQDENWVPSLEEIFEKIDR